MGGNPGAGFGGARVVKITPDAGGPVDVALEFLRREVQLAAARLAERHAFGSAGDDVWAGSSSKTMSRRAAEAARQRRGAGSPRVLREVRLHRIEAWDLAAPGSKVLRHTARHPSNGDFTANWTNTEPVPSLTRCAACTLPAYMMLSGACNPDAMVDSHLNLQPGSAASTAWRSATTTPAPQQKRTAFSAARPRDRSR